MEHFRIGKLSEISNTPIKTLRFYDEIGVLAPASVDLWTGYRYYNEESVEKVFLIKTLKDLGFSLNEIKTFNFKDLGKKSVEIEEKISKLKINVELLKKLKNKEDIRMFVKENQKFVNDEKAIGKWVLVDNKGKDIFDNDKGIKELYLMPNGEKYWVISWTKGLIIYDNCKRHVEYKYEIKNDIMSVYIPDENGEFDIKIFKKENSIHYTKETLPTYQDETDLPFVEDANIVGTWNSIDFVEEIRYFNPNEKFYTWGELLYKSITFKKNGEAVHESGGKAYNYLTYTKGLVLAIRNGTASKYTIKEINGKKYLFMEHKSGDYIWGGFVAGYYVFVKE